MFINMTIKCLFIIESQKRNTFLHVYAHNTKTL
nr:MAG TPA: hypothetical protein [Caudoviricetes sp.]